jgi:hypothetical protein
MIPETEYTSLVWHPMPHLGGPHPETTTCIFTDGVCCYWTGWADRHSDKIYLNTEESEDFSGLPVLHKSRVKYWAHPGNFRVATGRTKTV